jgi:two-component system cell cycle sensor histidine kinase/response regulator CckA
MAKAALERSKEQFRSVIESSKDGMIAINPEGIITLFNSAAEQIFGYNQSEMINQTLNKIIPVEYQTIHKKYVQDFFTTGKPNNAINQTTELLAVRKDGSTFPIDLSLSEGKYGNERFVLAVIRDITDRTKNEEERARLATAIENAVESIIITDLDGVIQYVNPTFVRKLGYSRDEIIGQKTDILRSDKQSNEFYETIWNQIQQGKVWTGRIINKAKDGSFLEHDSNLSPIFDPKGNTIGFVSVNRDVSQQVKLEEQLRQAQKMEALGKLAGGIAHDFNNLLLAILGYSEISLNETGIPDSIRNHLQEIRKSGERAASLTNQLLAFSRKQVLQLEQFNINELILNMDRMLRRLIGEDIELITIPSENSCSIKADKGQIEQVIMNLVVNARDAMPTGGKISIETNKIDVDKFFTYGSLELQSGDYVLLAISDTGHGMSKEVQKKIFDPFFTTKDIDKGTGLGLSTVYGIVTQCKGHISVYSVENQGTSFKIYFPYCCENRETSKTPIITTDTFNGDETILLVEDEKVVQDFISNILSQQGYNVLKASYGSEAIQINDEYSDEIQLLITDVVMPKMSGKEVAMHISQNRPSTKIIYMSGYTDSAIVQHGILEEGIVFLQKPFSAKRYYKKVRKVLNESE